MLDAWAPGWTATIDGEPASIERADLLVRAVKIPAGAHVVSFRYVAPGWHLGLLLAGLAWLGLVAVVLLLRKLEN